MNYKSFFRIDCTYLICSNSRSIVASKTITPTLYVINTAEDLLLSQLNVHSTSATAYYLKTSSSSTIKKMEDKIIPGLLTSLQEKIERSVI